MRTRFILVLTFLVSGCASSIQVDREEPINNDRVFNYDQVNERIAGSPGTIVCTDGTSYAMNGARIGTDTTVFRDEAGLERRIATAAIDAIEYKEHGRGALTGALAGGVAAVGSAVAIFVIGGNSEEVRGAAMGLVLLGAPAGIVLGGVIGGLEGSTQRFEFRHQAAR